MRTTKRNVRGLFGLTFTPMSRARRVLISSLCAVVIGGLAARVQADSFSTGFEPGEGYAPGSINGQNTWGGQNPPGIAVNTSIDQEVTTAGFCSGTQSYRESSFFTSGSFGDQVFSPSLTDAAGEPGAIDGGFANTTNLQPRFSATVHFKSVTGAAQDSHVVISPDRGDGARMSWIQVSDNITDPGDGRVGLSVSFFEYRLTSNAGNDCDGGPSQLDAENKCFIFAVLATNLDRSTCHSIDLVMDFVDGPANDVVSVSVDGGPAFVGTSWEDYFRNNQNPPFTDAPPVDSLLFRVGGAAEGNSGEGFFFDDVSYASGPAPACGNLVVNLGEQCDPPGSSTCGAFVGGSCGVDCQCPTTTTTSTVAPSTSTTTTSSTTTTTAAACGNMVLDFGEQCDPPGSSTCGAFVGGSCGLDCQCPTTTTTVAPPTSTSTTTVATTSSTTVTVVTTSTTTTTLCMPQPENTSPACSNMLDDDCDGLPDCADPDCSGIFPCPKASKDPTLIKFGRAGGLDLIKGHAKLDMAPADITAMRVGVLLTNPNGAVYSGSLPAGALTAGSNGRTFRFQNPDARAGGGIYSVKIKQSSDRRSYTFSFASYGNLSAATDSHMRLQFYVGEDPAAARDGRIFITIDTPWTQTPRGWRAPKDH